MTSVQIQEISLTSVSSKKYHCTNDFVPKISSSLGFHPFHAVKYTIYPITLKCTE